MLTEKDLRELLDFSADAPVMSLYLNTAPAEGSAEAYKLRLRNMLKEVVLPQDTQAVESYFNHEYDGSGRSVAIFSCAAENFFRAYPLAVPIPDQLYVNYRPAVKPLADILDAYGGYGVVLVDKQGARLFFFHLGELREQEGVVGEIVHHTKRGGASSIAGRRGGAAGQTRYADEVVDRNMRDSLDFAMRFFKENHVRRILIGGTDENVALFRGLLPKALQSLVVGTFAMSMTASHTEVLNRALQIGIEAEQRRESRLIDTVIDAAAKGNGGVTGLADTLTAVRDGRAMTLLVSEGYAQAGYRCENCGNLSLNHEAVCALCSGEVKQIPDAVEIAVRSVLKNGGIVEVIHGSPALMQAGRIGAFLRY